MKRLQTIDADTLQSTVYEPIPFLISALLPQGLHLLAGAPKIGKSWLALWLCLRVAQGEPLWTFETKPCEVLYLCLEDRFQRIQSRLFNLTEDAPPTLHFAIMSEQLHNGLVEQIKQFLKEHPATGLIVIDTLQRIRAAGNDANPYANDYRDIGVLKALADEQHISILLVHHLRKMNDEDPMNMISGTTGLSGATDSNFVLRKSRRGGNTATLYCTGRDIAYWELKLEFDTVNHIWNLLSDDHETEPEPQNEIIFAVSAFLAAQGSFVGTATELVEALKPYSAREWTAAVLSKKLIRYSAELKARGICFESDRTRERREIRLCLVSDSNDGSDGKNETGSVAELLSQPSRCHEADKTAPRFAPVSRCVASRERWRESTPAEVLFRATARNEGKSARRGIFPPKQGSRRSPASAGSVGRGRATERARPAACGGARDLSSARTTASIAFVWSAATPLPCQTLLYGQKPEPTSVTIGGIKNEERHQIQHPHGN